MRQDDPAVDSGLGRAEESALAAIVLSSQDAVIAKTVDGVVTAWNDGATKIYGYSAGEMLGASLERTFSEGSVKEERERHARVAAGVAESGFRCLRVRRDGRPVEVVMSMSPIRDLVGAVIGIASISRPVSARERADERFASLLEAAPDAMLCVGADGRIVTMNAQVSALFGYERRELVGAELELLVPEGARRGHPAHRADFFRQPVSRQMGTGLALGGRRKDGSTFPIEVSLSVDHNAGETLVIAAIRDVTCQRETQRALLESETRLRQLAENVDTVFTLRQVEPPAYLYLSPGIARLTGWTAEEIIADPGLGRRMIHPDDADRVDGLLFGPGPPSETASSEHRIVCCDGSVRWVRSRSTMVPTQDSEPARVVTTIEDVTEQVLAERVLAKAEASARAANEAKNEFLSRMSHELRTPLNAVLGFGQLLERSLQDSAQLDSVQHILSAGRHLLNLINDVLDIARIEARELSISPEPVPVAVIVDESVRLMAPLASAASVTITVRGGPEGAYVLADRQRLRQVLLNLISNAVKYNRRGGAVEVSWAGDGDQGHISVRDDGPGIPMELQDRLFVPFDRLGAESTGVEGAGVGLTVSRGLAEHMHGALTFESGTGRGTTFTVTLPATQGQDRGAARSAPTAASPAGGPDARTSVLYVEDNEPNVQVMEAVVRLRPSWEFLHTPLGVQAIDLARSSPPDLVLLDLHLPDVPGADVLAALRSDPSTTDIPVVVLSADASASQVTRLLRAGARQYLTKPIDVDDVLAVLDGVVEARRRERSRR